MAAFPLDSRPDGVLAVVILGNDAVLAALPAHPVQLAHACHALGFQHVVPASWGEELIAAAIVREAALADLRPLVPCSCPRVRARLADGAMELGPALLGFVPPPVAAARYVRRSLEGSPVHITYVGTCEATGHAGLDAQLSPIELLARIQASGIDLEQLPTAFEGVVPPDRRRHYSHPGGTPSPEALSERQLPYVLVALPDDEPLLALAELLLARRTCIADVAPALGCACAGGSAGGGRRVAITSLEPPRSGAPLLDGRLLVDLADPIITADESRAQDASGGALSKAQSVVARTPARALQALSLHDRPVWWRRFGSPANDLAIPITPAREDESTHHAAGDIHDVEPARNPSDSPGAEAESVVALDPDEVATRDNVESLGASAESPSPVAPEHTAAQVLRRSPAVVRRVPPPPAARRRLHLPLLLAILAAAMGVWLVFR